MFQLSKVSVESFVDDGFLLIPKFYEQDLVTEIRKDINLIIGLTADSLGLGQDFEDQRNYSADFSDFDKNFNVMLKKNRTVGSTVYDAVKHLLSFHYLMNLSQHAEVMRQLRVGSKPAIASGGYGIRIDNPQEERFRTFWHQEYPSQLRSLNGLVFWSPLVEMTREIGPVQLARGSHKLGPCKVFLVRDDNRVGPYQLKLCDEEQLLSSFEILSPLIQPGDVLVMDYLTLHASGVNISKRSRWSMQFRYFDFLDPNGVSIGWQGSFAAGADFARLHPELLDKNLSQ